MEREDLTLADALERANLVVLVSALAHLTGDRSLLSRYPVAKFETSVRALIGAVGVPKHEGLVWGHPKVHSYYNNATGRVTTNGRGS